MNLYFFTEARFDRIDGVIWTSPGFSMDLWQRYLPFFDRIYVVGRVRRIDSVRGDNIVRLESDSVSVVDLPYYVGAVGFIRSRREIEKIIGGLVHPGDAYLCRVPGNIGTIAGSCLKKRQIPYGLEIVGDPWESLSRRALNSPAAPVLQLIGRNRLRRLAEHASAALYVTEHILQERYPVPSGRFTVSASNVILKDENYSDSPQPVRQNLRNGTIRLLAVGSLAQLYKAPDVVLRAMSLLRERGCRVRLTWFGDGKYREPMERLAVHLGLAGSVDFAGSVKPDAIRRQYGETDIFVHVSRTEGLPRALIEAMAYGLPCIGSDVGGIPELIGPDAIVKPGDAPGLADKIEWLADHPDMMRDLGRINWEKAREYHNDILTVNRNRFYRKIAEISSL